MAAGESATISIPVSRGGKVRLVMKAADINTAVANTADGIVQTEGGQVLMQAASVGDAIASIRHSGQIDTSGAQGGDVTLRADHGNITVDGSITANSTTNNTEATGTPSVAGGSIVIGRADDDSGNMVLTSRTDVSGATLHSGGGFVETSGDALVFDHVRVQAKNWLLDPVDVSINQTQANTIATNLASTDVTVQTTNATTALPGSGTTGDGTITLSGTITKTDATDHTLTFTANNGIVLNNAISATGTGKLNVVMTASGTTTSTNSTANSKGITLNSTINANGGTVNLTGTNNASGGNGVSFVGVSGITAASYNVTGISTSTTAGNGVVFDGIVNLTSASGNSLVRGTTAAPSSAATYYGIFGFSGSVLTIASGDGKAVVDSPANSTAGVRFGYGGKATVNTSGDVTLGSKSSSSSGFRLQGDINATSGQLSILGKTNDTGTGGIQLQDYGGTASNITGTNASITINGEHTAAGAGVDLSVNSSVNMLKNAGTTGSISVTGISASGIGINIGAANLSNTATNTSGNNGSVTLGGTTSSGTGNAIYQGTTSTISAANTLTITGTGVSGRGLSLSGTASATNAISLKGYTTGSGSIGLYTTGGLTSTAGNITLYGESITQQGVYVTGVLNATAGSVNVTGLTTTVGTTVGVTLDGTTINAQTVNLKNDAVTTATAITGTLRNNVSLLSTNTFSTTGSTGTTIIGTASAGVGGDGVRVATVNSSGALSITGTASDTGSSGVVLVDGAVITATGSNSTVTLSGTVNNANSGGTAANISGAVKGVNGAAVTVSGTTNGTGMAVSTPQDTTAVGSSPGNIGNIGGATAGTVTINGTITNAASTANAVNLKGITTSANAIRITGTTAGSGAGVALLSDPSWSATKTSWTRTWSDSTWTASGLAGTNTISINGTATGTSGTGVLVSGQSVTNANGNTSVVGNGMGGGVSLVGTSYTSGSTTGTNTALLTAKSLGTQTVTVTGNLTGNTVGAGVTFGANSGVDANSMAVQGSTTAATNTATNYGVRLQGSFTTTRNSTVTGTATSSDLLGVTGSSLGSGVRFDETTAITTASGTTLTVKGTSTNGAGVEVGGSIVSGTGDAGTLALDGTTLYRGGRGNIGAAGVKFASGVATKNLAVTGLGYSGDSNITSLGIYIAGVVLGSQTATDTITLTGTSNNGNAGSYAYYGTVQAKGNIVINGSGAGLTSGTSLEGVNKVISASGSVSITGSTPGPVDAISLGAGSSVTAASGAGVTLASNGGGIAATGSTITNGTGGSTGNGTGGITVSSDYGDITLETIANHGSGNVVLAAGTKVAAGVGTGGNVALASGGTLSNNGGLYIYTGSYNSFGSIASQWNGLTKTGSGFGTLYYNGSSNPRNVGFNSAWSSANTALANGDTNQVVFRENKTPAAFSITLGNTQATYGAEAYPTSQTAELVRLKNTYTGSSTLTQTDGANTFSLASADVLAGLGATRTLGSQSAGGYENANTAGYAYSASINSSLGLNTTISNSGTLVHIINKASATVTANSASAIYNGTTQSVTGFTVSGLVAGEDASVLTGVTASGTGKNAGTWVSTASGNDNNYNLSFQNGSLVIGKANATVTANSASVAYNGTTQSVTGFTASGLVAGENASVLTGVRVAGAGKYEGTYTTSASGSDGNYNLAFVDGSLTISAVATPYADAVTSLCSQTFGGTHAREGRIAGGMAGSGGLGASYSITLVTGNSGITTTRHIAGNPSRNSQSTQWNRCLL